ncbi:MAG: hypothetical protein ACM3XS_04365 [Bacteroidota bacterium]
MLLSTGRLIALRCPLCGKFATHALSLFSFVRNRSLRVVCGCGFNILTISSAAHKNYLMQVSCLACAGTHHLRLDRREFWGDKVCRLGCPEIGVDIAFLGPEQAVHQIIEEGRHRLDSIANDLGFDDFFNHPDIMLGVLSHLHFLAENANLECQCGNRQMVVDVFPDKLELRCEVCRSLLIVYAETPDDLAAVRTMPRIIMTKHGFASIDACRMRQER